MAQSKHMTSHVLTINRTRTQAHDKPDTVTHNHDMTRGFMHVYYNCH